MKISELIAELLAIQAEHGPDLLVVKELPEPMGYAEVEEVAFAGMVANPDREPGDGNGDWLYSSTEPGTPGDTPSVYLS